MNMSVCVLWTIYEYVISFSVWKDCACAFVCVFVQERACASVHKHHVSVHISTAPGPPPTYISYPPLRHRQRPNIQAKTVLCHCANICVCMLRTVTVYNAPCAILVLRRSVLLLAVLSASCLSYARLYEYLLCCCCSGGFGINVDNFTFELLRAR